MPSYLFSTAKQIAENKNRRKRKRGLPVKGSNSSPPGQAHLESLSSSPGKRARCCVPAMPRPPTPPRRPGHAAASPPPSTCPGDAPKPPRSIPPLHGHFPLPPRPISPPVEDSLELPCRRRRGHCELELLKACPEASPSSTPSPCSR